MREVVKHKSLEIDSELYAFIKDEALVDSGVELQDFWDGFEKLLLNLGDKNLSFLKQRDAFQAKLDSWYLDKKEKGFSQEEHQEFLKSINYLVPKTQEFKIETSGVDPEIATTPGAQLVVPADNARYVLNAANARWGSLFDALYGTDMITERIPYEKTDKYNPIRGEKVFAFAFEFLDEIAPLCKGSFSYVVKSEFTQGKLLFTLDSGEQVGLKDESAFVGYTKVEDTLASILLKHNGLHVEIKLDREDFIGSKNTMGVKDVVIEAALSAIADCEDSVACVDAQDKVNIYRNWLGLMRGDLESTFESKGKTIHRKLNSDRVFLSPSGDTVSLKGRVLLLIRNVGMHMYSDAIKQDGKEIPEGFLDAYVTTLCASHDVKKTKGLRNSTQGSIYIVKPKCHGRDEIALMCEMFTHIEESLNLPLYTVKMGIMDEERRTTANLQECIKVAKNRVFFINTGFLDRTGDEIHSLMELGAVLPKEEIKQEPWLKGYENQNVDVGLHVGFSGVAQVGKGMWTMPDLMDAMYKTKLAHPLSGANTAWVPSPTAATIHALHYHKVDVLALQKEIAQRQMAKLDDILTPPLLKRELSHEEITKEIENNIQSILGYVVRWVDQGIGCSKVPDINDVELMEDRATLRISSQHLANWLHHGVVSKDEVMETFKKMAVVVDKQNAGDINYKNMAPDFEKSIAFAAACDLVFEGRNQPNGYTEFILHKRRREVKAQR